MRLLSEILKETRTRPPTGDRIYYPPQLQKTICKPDCPICFGVGWVRHELPVTDPDFGKLFRCENVSVTHLLGDRIGLTDDEKALGFDDVNLTIGGHPTQEALAAVKAVIQAGYGWVYLWGGYGSAKTLILKIAVAEYLRINRPAIYVRMASIFDDLRQVYDENSGYGTDYAETRRLDYWVNTSLLAIDELDRIRETGFSAERRFMLLDRRYENVCNKSGITIMASNVPPAKLPGYLNDRIIDGRFTVIQLTQVSARPFMEWKNV